MSKAHSPAEDNLGAQCQSGADEPDVQRRHRRGQEEGSNVGERHQPIRNRRAPPVPVSRGAQWRRAPAFENRGRLGG